MTLALLGAILVQSTAISLPDTPPRPGWQPRAERRITPAKIFDYMDGAGELYLAYGFRSLLVRDYAKPGEPKITCELYQMPSSADAFGLFSQDRAEDFVRHYFSPGFHFLVTPNLEVSARVGWGLNDQSARFFSNVGFGWRF